MEIDEDLLKEVLGFIDNNSGGKMSPHGWSPDELYSTLSEAMDKQRVESRVWGDSPV